jgi:hypothetical protein
MSFRNLSPQQMFQQMAEDHTPLYHFDGSSRDEFDAWKEAALPQVLATLGDYPDSVPPNPELMVEWEHDGLRKQRWLIEEETQI